MIFADTIFLGILLHYFFSILFALLLFDEFFPIFTKQTFWRVFVSRFFSDFVDFFDQHRIHEFFNKTTTNVILSSAFLRR